MEQSGMKRSIHSMFLAGLLCLLTFCDPSDFQLPVHQIDLIVPLFDIDLSINDLMWLVILGWEFYRL